MWQWSLPRVTAAGPRRVVGRLLAEPFACLSVIQLLEEVSNRGVR